MRVFDKFLDAIKLNDDYDDDEFFDDEFDDEELLALDEEEEKPRKKFMDKFKKKDFDDDDFLDEDPVPVKKTTKQPKQVNVRESVKTTKTVQTSRPSSSKITPMRSNKKAGQGMEVCVIKPVSMEDTKELADTLVDNCTVVLNLEGVDVELAQRIIDFTSGCCYSLGGSLQKISSYIFIITPYNVDISGDFQDILSGTIPSMRSQF